MRKHWTAVVEGLLALVAIGLVATFFLTGMLGGQAKDPEATPQPTGSRSSGPAPLPTPSPVGDVKPGVPTVPVAEHPVWPAEDIPLEPDRQLTDTESDKKYDKGLGTDLTPYWDQKLDWHDCDGDQCTKVRVPLDWDKPGDASIEVAVRRIPSAHPGKGPLFVNPGGPGFGGQDYARRLGRDAFEGYDMIGWDPRGTGESTHVVCGDQRQTDELFGLDTSPDDEAERRALEDGYKDFAKECRRNSGALLDHLTTIDVVRDLDLLRYLLGAEKFNYLGVSYGTFVGAMYAELFPDRTGRLVLDSAMNITDDDSVKQVEGFELAFDNFAKWCATSDACDLGDDEAGITRTVADFLSGLDAHPIEVDGRELTQGLATTGIAVFLYADASAYPDLAFVLGAAIDGDGSFLLQAADQMNGRTDKGYETVAYAFPAMMCADWPDGGVEHSYREFEKYVKESPIFAANGGVEFPCEYWTAKAAPTIKITAKGAPEILVVGTTGDSATPYEHAVSMAEQLDKARLLTLEGAGHGAVTSGNECIKEAVDRYFDSGELPEVGTRCKS